MSFIFPNFITIVVRKGELISNLKDYNYDKSTILLYFNWKKKSEWLKRRRGKENMIFIRGDKITWETCEEETYKIDFHKMAGNNWRVIGLFVW